MISVLIPVYNYNIQKLISSLVTQFQLVNFDWEILVSDDASAKSLRSENLNFILFISKVINICEYNKSVSNNNRPRNGQHKAIGNKQGCTNSINNS